MVENSNEILSILQKQEELNQELTRLTRPIVYGYARVSTKKQENGNSLDAQIKALKENGATEIVTDTYSGKTMDRPNFSSLIGKMKKGDTLVVTKLDRFARTVQQGLVIIDSLLEKGVKVYVLNMGILDNSPTGKIIRTILLAISEFERDMIVERTQEGKEIARSNPNYKEGRPKKYTKDQIALAMKLLDSYSYTQVEKLTGISKSTLYREHKTYSPLLYQDEFTIPGQMNIEDFIV